MRGFVYVDFGVGPGEMSAVALSRLAEAERLDDVRIPAGVQVWAESTETASAVRVARLLADGVDFRENGAAAGFEWEVDQSAAGVTVVLDLSRIPGEADLRRDEQICGFAQLMESSRREREAWNFPVLFHHRADGTTEQLLPGRGRLKGKRFVREPKEIYRALCERGLRLFEWVVAGVQGEEGEQGLEEGDLFGVVVQGLAVNYRVDVAECNLLGLLDEGGLFAVVRGLTGLRDVDDVARVLAWEKTPGKG